MEEGLERHAEHGQSPRAHDVQGKSAFWEGHREGGRSEGGRSKAGEILGQVSDSSECQAINTLHLLPNVLKHSSDLLRGIHLR